MNGRKGLIVFGAGVLASACLVGTAVTGCQSGSNGGGGGTGGSSGTQSTSTNSGPGGSVSTSTMSTSSSMATSMSTSTSTSSSMTSSSSGGGCTSDMDATLDQVAKGADNGGIGPGVHVHITGAVVTSHKFLVSQSKTTGSCLWGVFISAPVSQAAEYTGVLAVSYGDDAVTNDAGKAFCPVPGVTGPAGDAFPDDIAPGDVIDLIGKTDSYAPTSCMNMAGVQLANVCMATKTGTASVPTPAVLSNGDAQKIATGDAATVAKWAGVRVELDNVVPVIQNTCTSCTPPKSNCSTMDLTGCYGDITLQGSNLAVTDKVYYQGLLKAQGKTCHEGPTYATNPQMFTKISGMVGLDYCTWEVYPDDKCTDIAPSDDDCMMPGGCTN